MRSRVSRDRTRWPSVALDQYRRRPETAEVPVRTQDARHVLDVFCTDHSEVDVLVVVHHELRDIGTVGDRVDVHIGVPVPQFVDRIPETMLWTDEKHWLAAYFSLIHCAFDDRSVVGVLRSGDDDPFDSVLRSVNVRADDRDGTPRGAGEGRRRWIPIWLRRTGPRRRSQCTASPRHGTRQRATRLAVRRRLLFPP